MKTQLRTIAGMAILFAAISSSAQVQHRTEVTVPFAFQAGGQLYPAGVYRISFERDNDLVTISSEKKTLASMIGTGGDSGRADRSYVRFARAGQTWFLHDVVVAGEVEQLPVSKAEREALASANAAQRKATIANLVVR